MASTRKKSAITEHTNAQGTAPAPVTEKPPRRTRSNGVTVDLKALKTSTKQAITLAKLGARDLGKAENASLKAIERYNKLQAKDAALRERHAQGRGHRLSESVREQFAASKTLLKTVRDERKAARLALIEATRHSALVAKAADKATKQLEKATG